MQRPSRPRNGNAAVKRAGPSASFSSYNRGLDGYEGDVKALEEAFKQNRRKVEALFSELDGDDEVEEGVLPTHSQAALISGTPGTQTGQGGPTNELSFDQLFSFACVANDASNAAVISGRRPGNSQAGATSAAGRSESGALPATGTAVVPEGPAGRGEKRKLSADEPEPVVVKASGEVQTSTGPTVEETPMSYLDIGAGGKMSNRMGIDKHVGAFVDIVKGMKEQDKGQTVQTLKNVRPGAGLKADMGKWVSKVASLDVLKAMRNNEPKAPLQAGSFWHAVLEDLKAKRAAPVHGGCTGCKHEACNWAAQHKRGAAQSRAG